MRNLKQSSCFFLLAVIVALYTQFPNADKSVASMVNYAAWITAILVIIRVHQAHIYFNKQIRILIALSVFTYLFQTVLAFVGVLQGVMPYVSLSVIPIIVYFVSYSISRDNESEELISIILFVFCAVVMIIAIQIASQFVINFRSWNNTEVYLYDGSTHKNSTGTIIGSCFVILLLFFQSNKFWQKVLKLACLVIMIMALLYIQSRSALISLAVAVAFAVLFSPIKARTKLLLILGLTAALFVVLNSEFVVSIIRQAFLIDKYSKSGSLDFNKFSSGRLNYWKKCWEYFLESPIWGKGSTYCDNFYINALSSGGIVFGGGYLIYYFARIKQNFKYYRNSSPNDRNYRLYYSLACTSVFYFCISVFEGFPPYGPGVASMLLWLLSGYVDGDNDRLPIRELGVE